MHEANLRDTLRSFEDPILQMIVAEIPRPAMASTGNVFHDLMSCILEQQIHYRSTKKTFQKMLNAAGLAQLTLNNFAQFEEKAFVHSKFAASKYETIANVLTFWQANAIDWAKLSDDEVAANLLRIKGIGKWTIDMILLFTLQRPNVFPYDDYHLKQVMVQLYGLDAKSKLKAQMVEIAKQWGEDKSLAVQYLLAWKKHNKMG